MTDGFELDPGRLTAEVSDLFGVSDQLDGAVSAGLAAQEMSERAFGLLCVAMVPPSVTAQSAAVAALRAEAAAYEAVAMNLRNALTDYETVDSAAAARFREIQGRLR